MGDLLLNNLGIDFISIFFKFVLVWFCGLMPKSGLGQVLVA